MHPKSMLRVEGLSVFLVAVAAFYLSDGPWWLFVGLALAPDLSMVGYLAGASVGSRIYNACHTYVAPLAVGVAGLWLGLPLLWWGALVWAAHIGADRAVGYGLKYPTAFAHTHLSEGADRPPAGHDPDATADEAVVGAD